MAEQHNSQPETQSEAIHPDQNNSSEEHFKPKSVYFSFTGSGSEYFFIWITNVVFSIISLGLYSPWAKVRHLKYFYQNTHLDGNRFDFHGNPIAILKGRLIVFFVVALFALFSHLGNHAYSEVPLGSIAFGFLLLGLIFLPALIVKSLQFRTSNTSYRGLRFSFSGCKKEAFINGMLFPFLSFLFLFLIPFTLPLIHYKLKQYLVNHCHYGNKRFNFSATAGDFYTTYLHITAFSLPGIIILFILLSILQMINSIILIILHIPPVLTIPYHIPGLFFYDETFFIILLSGWFVSIALLQNLFWNHTCVSDNPFHSQVSAKKLFFIYLTNLFGIIFSFGLFIPFARIRAIKYRLSCLSLTLNASFEQFSAGEKQENPALKDAVADWFDLDISF